MAIPWNIIVPVGTAILGGIFGSKNKKKTAPAPPPPQPTPPQPKPPTTEQPPVTLPEAPQLGVMPEAPQLGAMPKLSSGPSLTSYLPSGWNAAQTESYDFLRNVLGGAEGALGQQLYEGQKERLDEARGEAYDRLREDAIRRGIYDSGVATSNMQELEKNYGNMLTQAARDAEIYNQQQRWSALNAIMTGRPLGLDVYQKDMEKHYSDYDRAMQQYYGDYDRATAQRYGDYDRAMAQRYGDYDRLLSQQLGLRDREMKQYYSDYDRALQQYYSDYNTAQREQDAWYDNLARILGYTYPYWSTWGK